MRRFVMASRVGAALLALCVVASSATASAQGRLPAYCAAPQDYCERAMPEICLNPFAQSDADVDCDQEFNQLDFCLNNVEQICSEARGPEAPPAPSDPVETRSASVPQNEARIALVIGNSNYTGAITRLRNPENDAFLVAETLRNLGFDVLEGRDLTTNEMRRMLSEFGQKLDNADEEQIVGLFFYAGHGVQIDGINYLIPVGEEINHKRDIVDLWGIPATAALAQMQNARVDVRLMFLDACRNNPFEFDDTRGLGRGLAPINAPQNAPTGSLVSFATAPGAVASDGAGDNSPFTLALVDAVKRPGIEIERGMKLVRRAVSEATDGRQLPFTSSSMIGDFFFAK